MASILAYITSLVVIIANVQMHISRFWDDQHCWNVVTGSAILDYIYCDFHCRYQNIMLIFDFAGFFVSCNTL